MKKVILIDADQFMFMNVNDKIDIKSKVENKIRDICDIIQVSNFSIVLSSRNNKRKNEFSFYKENRKDNVLPEFYNDIREYLVNNYNVMEVDGEEADDIIAFFKRKNTDGYIIASQDKDLLYNFPGPHINTHYKCMSILNVDKSENERFFNIQMLVGDDIDNIPRLEINDIFKKKHKLASNRGMTEKTAGNLLDKTNLTYKDFVLDCYLDNGKSMEDYLNQIKLIMMGYDKIDIELKYDKIDIQYTKKINYDFILEFGKYRGQLFSKVFESDKGYIDYIHKTTYDKELINKMHNYYEQIKK